jgi:recombination associated protein RdgC
MLVGSTLPLNHLAVASSSVSGTILCPFIQVKYLMWFKNLRAYRLSPGFDVSAEKLEEQLQSRLFTPCGKTQNTSCGWVSPLGGEAELLVHAANGRLMICMKREERLLPSSVVKEMVDEKVAVVELAEARKVRRRERGGIKEEVILESLPRAFTRSTPVYAILDVAAGWLLVDAASASRAEELTSLLRECIGSFPLLLPEVNNSPSAVMTSWLQNGSPPKNILLGEECELRDPGEDGAIVRLRRQDLTSEEVQVHLEAGKHVVQLSLELDGQLRFIIGEDLNLKRLRFADEMLTGNEDIDSEDVAARFDADYVLMSEMLAPLFDRLLGYFGGELRDR